ncbi:MAG: helix-turn-helix domain-containing protein [Pseudomonadota bacterium]
MTDDSAVERSPAYAPTHDPVKDEPVTLKLEAPSHRLANATLGENATLDEEDGAPAVARVQMPPVPSGMDRQAVMMFCFTLASLLFHVETKQIFGKTRSLRRVSSARQVGMYLSHTLFGVTFGEIADLLRRDRTTVRHGVRRVEDLREDPEFDELITSVEVLLDTVSKPRVARFIWDGV